MHIAWKKDDTLTIQVSKDFSLGGKLWISTEEISQWIFQEQIQTTHLSAYMGFLQVAQQEMFQYAFGFFCPFQIAECPLEFGEDRLKDRLVHGEVRMTERTRYIAHAMKNAKKHQMFFAPYNAKNHWMLCVIHPFNEIVYWFDPLGFTVRDDIKRVIETALVKQII